MLIYLDAGHGGNDPGAGGNGLAEKDITLELARKTRDILQDRWQCKVKMTRDADKTVSLGQRTKMANDDKADCFVSFHVNGHANSKANGFESFVFTTDNESSKSASLQRAIHNRVKRLWPVDRGRKRANFHVLREFKGASVLLEFGFITNPEDARMLKDDVYLHGNALEVARGIADHLSLQYKQVVKPVYRVTVDGTQVGAYSEPDNILRQVAQAVKSQSDVTITKI